MPQPPEGPTPAEAWLEARFAAYYARHPPTLPDRFGRREYGFLFFGRKSMLRHVGFATRAEFERFHARRAPAHSYYSTAFYERPDAGTMQEKGWMGAELIFDLDADHVPGAEKLAYPDQLKRVKEHFVRLVDEFIRRDFGFAEDELLLTFSGGRGYHCHVLAEAALSLTSQERREIVDYVTGTGVALDRFAWVERRSRGGSSRYAQVVNTLRISPDGEPGWGGRLNRGVVEYVRQLKGMKLEELTEECRAFKGPKGNELSDKGRAKLARELAEELAKLDDPKLLRIAQGFADQGNLTKKLIPVVLTHKIVPLAKGETDEPVTSDTKRLIRTPGTLHGKSGLRVLELSRDDIDSFDPLVDAVAFGDEPVGVDVTKPLTVGLKGETLRLDTGRARIPEWAAVFAMMRGAARPAGD